MQPGKSKQCFRQGRKVLGQKPSSEAELGWRLRLALANTRPTYGMTADERLYYVETAMADITGRSGDKDLGQP